MKRKMNTDKLLRMLLEAIDYSFLQVDGSYDKTLTYPVIDKIQYIKEQVKNMKVKEVDLEKHLKEDIEDVFFDLNGVAVKGATHYLTVEDVKDIAKHFYELGLQARTDKELIKEVYSHLDDIKDTADRMTSGNFMHHRAAIKFSANTIAKVLELIGLKAKKGDKV